MERSWSMHEETRMAQTILFKKNITEEHVADWTRLNRVINKHVLKM
jgi:hypothetical protein